MSRGLNRVMIIGNLGRDPELKYTQKGTAVGNFTVAATRRIQNRTTEEWQDDTTWFRVVVWEKDAEKMSEMLRKGSKVYVEGRLQTRTWEGPDGQKHDTWEVVAAPGGILLLDARDPNRAPGEVAARVASGPGDLDGIDTEDDIPF